MSVSRHIPQNNIERFLISICRVIPKSCQGIVLLVLTLTFFPVIISGFILCTVTHGLRQPSAAKNPVKISGKQRNRPATAYAMESGAGEMVGA